MSRQPRPNLPGCAFHVTARLQDRAHRFTAPLRDHVVRQLDRQAARSDAQLLAFVVMTNHLHLVLIQGAQPLGRFMQPFLRSVALAVQGTSGIEGHVFERRFRDRVCRDLRHLQNAIAYTHANPLRAGLCDSSSADAWRWSSHSLYMPGGGAGPILCEVDLVRGLHSFTPQGWPGLREAKEAYAAFFKGFLAVPEAPAPPSGVSPASPPLPAETQQQRLSPDLRITGSHSPPGVRRAGTTVQGRRCISAIATGVLHSIGSPLSLRDVLSRWGPRSGLSARSAIAHAASREGHSGVEIAAFLKVSEATVSRMLRNGLLARGPIAAGGADRRSW